MYQSMFLLILLMNLKCSLQSTSMDSIQGVCIPEYEASDIKLSCGIEDVIAIHEAFLTSSPKQLCPFLSQSHERHNHSLSTCTEDIRLSMNNRCSGRPNCTFDLRHDHVKTCHGNGYVVIRYACVSPASLHTYCNVDLTERSGYIVQPGYPLYYPNIQCQWKIIAGHGQTIEIDVLDAFIKEPKEVTELGPPGCFFCIPQKPKLVCTDKVVISEGQNKLLVICGKPLSNLKRIRSEGNELTVQFIVEKFEPRRGVMMKYTVNGCMNLPAPVKGYLVGRNESYAVYSCCKDHVFEDTQTVTKTLYCVHNRDWDSYLGKCIPFPTTSKATKEPSETSYTSVHVRETNTSPFAQPDKVEHASFAYDVIVPVTVMAVLVVGNTILVWFLVKLRRRRRAARNETSQPLRSQEIEHV